VIFANGEYLIVGRSGNDIEVVRVSRSGTLNAPAAFVRHVDVEVSGLTIASSGSEMLISWKRIYSYPSAPVQTPGVSLEAQWTTLTGVPLAKAVGVPMNEIIGRFAAWTDPPAIATNRSTYLLVWTEGTSLENLPARNLFSILLRPVESMSNEDVGRRKRPIPSTFATQDSPSAARSGDQLLLAWSETFSDDNSGDPRQQIMATLDDGDVIVSPSESHQQNPSAAWDGKRTCAHGELLDMNGFLIGSGQSYIGVGDYDVAGDGSRFEVVWADRVFTGGAILRSVFFGPLTGGVTTRNGDLAATTASYRSPRIVWSGRGHDVLWVEGSTLRASRVSAEGTSLDGDSTGWAGVRVAQGVSLNALASAGSLLYVALGNAVVRIEREKFALLDSIAIDRPSAIAAFDSERLVVVHSIDSRLFTRAITPGRRRAAASTSSVGSD